METSLARVIETDRIVPAFYTPVFFTEHILRVTIDRKPRRNRIYIYIYVYRVSIDFDAFRGVDRTIYPG